MNIKFESSVIFVEDIQKSRHFYETILGQKVTADFGVNIGFEGGFAIFQRKYAHDVIFGRDMEYGLNNLELYFECGEIDEAVSGLQENDVKFIHAMVEQPWGQRVVRFYDPDGHIVEIGEPLSALVSRLAASGLNAEQISSKTSLTLEMVNHFLNEK
ncbi:MAG: VOC family protein [Anaerolineaceae bacterium]|nr:VOC family protein [Anaerolineaceae bacterium]